MRRRDNSSACTYCCSTVALRPPNSGGWPGSSQPLSNSSRCHCRAHGGTSDDDRERSHRVGLGGQVFVEKRDEFGAERFDVSVEGQLHARSVDRIPLRLLFAAVREYYSRQEKVTISDTSSREGDEHTQWQGVLRYSPIHVLPSRQAPSRP